MVATTTWKETKSSRRYIPKHSRTSSHKIFPEETEPYSHFCLPFASSFSRSNVVPIFRSEWENLPMNKNNPKSKFAQVTRFRMEQKVTINSQDSAHYCHTFEPRAEHCRHRPGRRPPTISFARNSPALHSYVISAARHPSILCGTDQIRT